MDEVLGNFAGWINFYIFLKKVIGKIVLGKSKVNIFKEISAPGPASTLYAHACTRNWGHLE